MRSPWAQIALLRSLNKNRNLRSHRLLSNHRHEPPHEGAPGYNNFRHWEKEVPEDLELHQIRRLYLPLLLARRRERRAFWGR